MRNFKFIGVTLSEDLKNLGPISREWLGAVGIHSRADLEAAGSIEAYRLVRMHGFNATMNLLYALEAALRNEHWTNLAPEVKARLNAAARKIKQER